MNSKEFKLEEEKLLKTIEITKEVLANKEKELKEIFNDFTNDREELWKLVDKKKIQIKNLETSLNKPYFARIDFTSDEDNKTNTIYIGKNGIMKNTDIIVTDWRAPISSLYYDAEVGRCSFISPSGTISGNMSLKRQYEIEFGKLQEYFDVDLVSNDGLLQKYLNSNNDSRLKSIVSTIQKEQNIVIRKNLFDNIIVQGVAGSGKTTVALHRIAYLVYNYMNTIKQNQYLVIGPNPVFLKYIKSVLPDLDVSNTKQSTFEDFAKNYIGEDIFINSSDEKVTLNIIGKSNSDIDKFKSSIKYKKMIDKFLEIYLYNITSTPLLLGDFEVIPQRKIKEIFEETEKNYSKDLSSRIEITIDRLCKYIENNYNNIISRYSDYSFKLFENANTTKEQNKYRNMFSKDKIEINKFCKSSLRKYFNKAKISTTKLYKLFINSVKDYDIYNYANIDMLKKETQKNIKNNSYDFEDLPALIHIKNFLTKNKDYETIKHTVIDEAQDLGEFSFYVLKNSLPSSTFSIFGDLAQSIYDYRGINSWNEVNDIMFNGQGEIINFNKSYRTTAEIMECADDVASSIGLNRSDIVVRHGNPVKITKIKKDKDIPLYIAKKISEYKNSGYKTIAIISKTDTLSSIINNELKKIGINIPNVTKNDDLTEEKFNICTISNQLAKGLEFDAVIINNVNNELYSSNNKLDMKLLYVAITRALHELDIVYSGTIAKPLHNTLEKQNN